MSLLLPNMSLKQVLLAATLSRIVLAQNGATPLSCSGPIDTQCCKNKGTDACSFPILGTVFSVKCVKAVGVSIDSHLITQAQEHSSHDDTTEWRGLKRILWPAI